VIIGYPNAVVQNQSTIVDKSGKKAIDPVSKEGRRLDHVVIDNGKVTRIVETTSPNASKAAQQAKEKRIVDSGGEYIRDRTSGKLLSIKNVSPETARVDVKNREIEYKRQ